jgi:hypothetical protein
MLPSGLWSLVHLCQEVARKTSRSGCVSTMTSTCISHTIHWNCIAIRCDFHVAVQMLHLRAKVKQKASENLPFHTIGFPRCTACNGSTTYKSETLDAAHQHQSHVQCQHRSSCPGWYTKHMHFAPTDIPNEQVNLIPIAVDFLA